MSDESGSFGTGMRGFELRAFIYELPVFAGALVLAFVMAEIYHWVVLYFDPTLQTQLAVYALSGMVFVGLMIVFWGASYYPKAVTVREDLIEFNMVFGRRKVGVSEIESVEALGPDETRKTFKSLKYFNLSAAVSGAVLLRRKKGRPWVFSPEDPDGFVAAARAAIDKDGGGAPE